MVAGLADEDVRRLDVAVDKPGRVCCIERPADLQGEASRLVE